MRTTLRRLSPSSFCLVALLACLAPALCAQEVLRPYVLPRVGEGFDPAEAEYFLLFPQWTGYGEATVRPVGIRAWRTVTDSVLFQLDDPMDGSILVSDSAATALAWYLDHFEILRRGDSPIFLSTSEKVPAHLRGGMKELYKRKVLPPWWPGWSRKEGEKLVHVVHKGGGSLRGRILAMTNRRLLLWLDSVSYTVKDINEQLRPLHWDDIDAVRVPDERSTELGWAGMYMMLAVANLAAGSENRQRKDVEGIATLMSNIGRAFLVGIGALGFYTSDPIVTEYRLAAPDDIGATVTRNGSPLREAGLLHPGMPPEIRAMIDTSAGERLLAGSEPLPLRRVPRADETIMPSGFWVGAEQLWLGQTQGMGFRTGLSAGYVLPLAERDPWWYRLGMDFIISGYRDFGSAGIRGVLQVH
jgi:hypothetical protein